MVDLIQSISEGKSEILYVNKQGEVAKSNYAQRIWRKFNPVYDTHCLQQIAEKILNYQSGTAEEEQQWVSASKTFLRASESRFKSKGLRKRIRKIDQKILAKSLNVDVKVYRQNPLFYKFVKEHHLDKSLKFQNAAGIDNLFKHKVYVDENFNVSLLVNGELRSWKEITTEFNLTKSDVKPNKISYLAKGLEKNNPSKNREIKAIRIRKLKDGEEPYQFKVKADFTPIPLPLIPFKRFHYGHAWVYRVSPDTEHEGYVKEESIGYFLQGFVKTPDTREQLPNMSTRKEYTAQRYNKEKHDKLTQVIEAVMARTTGDAKAFDKIVDPEAKVTANELYGVMEHGGTCGSFASYLLQVVDGVCMGDPRHPYIKKIFTPKVIETFDKIYAKLPSFGRFGSVLRTVQLVTRGYFPYQFGIFE